MLGLLFVFREQVSCAVQVSEVGDFVVAVAFVCEQVGDGSWLADEVGELFEAGVVLVVEAVDNLVLGIVDGFGLGLGEVAEVDGLGDGVVVLGANDIVVVVCVFEQDLVFGGD